MAATAPSSWGRPSLTSPSSETPPAAFPDRPMRPLPKRRIKSRLSEEQAESIVFPPVPPSSSPLFGSPRSQSDRSFVNPHYSAEAHALSDDREHDHFCDCDHHSAGESDEEEEDRDSLSHRNSWPGRTMRYPREYKERVVSQLRSPPPNSSTSSADGYESFENTNNKKKRKIPVSGAPGQAASDVAMSTPAQSLDVSNGTESAPRTSYGHVSGAQSSGTGIGISGPGRGRYHRSSNRPSAERRPLTTSTNAMNTFPNGSQGSQSDKGIISTAIANAAETGPVSPPKGQENVSLLQQQNEANAVPQNFTFEYKSASSDKLASARPTVPPPPLPKPPTSMNPPQVAKPRAQATTNGASPHPQQQSGGTQTSQQAPAAQDAPQPKAAKPRRPGHALRMAAFRRKEQKRFDNYYNPPKAEDIWVCEFCEYEAIFGQEPTALIRQYEIRERKERKEREKNRRRLEQAKAKGRKNKKNKSGNKNTANAGANNNNAANQRYDAQYDAPHDVDSQGEEFFDDEYDDSIPGPSPLDAEPGAYAAHEYPPPPSVGPVEEHVPNTANGPPSRRT